MTQEDKKTRGQGGRSEEKERLEIRDAPSQFVTWHLYEKRFLPFYQLARVLARGSLSKSTFDVIYVGYQGTV